MGMFTTILLEGEDKGEIQFKTGYDYCDTYKVGDTINFDPSFWGPGAWIDGAHIGYDQDGRLVIVAIKDKTIVAVETDVDVKCKDIIEKYEIQTKAPRELWSEDQWAALFRLAAEAKKRWEVSLDKHGGDFRSAYLDMMMSEESILSRILPQKHEDPADT